MAICNRGVESALPSVSSRFRMRAVVGLACLLATCALRAQDAGTEVAMAIPDDGLRRCAVTEALGKAPDLDPLSDLANLLLLELKDNDIVDEAVSQDEMATLAELSSTCDQAIVDLTGLEYASGLQILKLPGNAIVDLDPLSDLANLLLLELKDNDIVDIAPLSGLTALGTLGLSGEVDLVLGPRSRLRRLRLATARLLPRRLLGVPATLEFLFILGLLRLVALLRPAQLRLGTIGSGCRR